MQEGAYRGRHASASVTRLRRFNGHSARSLLCLILVSLLVAGFGVFGCSIMTTGYYEDSFGTLALRTIAWTPVCFGVISALEYAFLAYSRTRGKASSARRVSRISIDRFTPCANGKSIALFTIVMLVFWEAWMLAVYPGSMNWDTYYQIAQCYPENHPIYYIPYAPTESFVSNYFSDHHPIFDTLIFGGFAMASDYLFGTWNYGVFAFVLIQSVGTAAAFTYALAYFRKLGVPAAIRFGAFVFFALMPFYPVYAATMLKDSFFSWLYVPYFIQVVEIVRTKGAALDSRKFLTAFVVLGILLALTKKTGMYAVVPAALILLFVYRSHWKSLALQAVSVLVVMQLVLPYIVFPALDVIPGGKQEVLSPLFQSTARYVVLAGDEVTEGERDAIDIVLGYDTLAKRYNPRDSDPVKFLYNYNASNEEMLSYYKTWLQQGLKRPDIYIDSVMTTTSSYFAPGGTLALHEDTGDVEHDGSPLLWRPERLQGIHDVLFSAYHWLCAFPVLGDTVFSVALYAFWIPLFAVYYLGRHAKRYVPALIPSILALALCVITPVFHARYALPLIYTAPLTVCLLCLPLRCVGSQNAGEPAARLHVKGKN